MIRRPPRSTLFPYTTALPICIGPGHALVLAQMLGPGLHQEPLDHPARLARVLGRSEEHTSELQSQSNLVCRLLLEKKKIKSHASCAQADVRSPCVLSPASIRR